LVQGAFGPLALAAVLASPAEAQVMAPAALPPDAVRQIEAVLAEKARRTPAQRKVSSRLLRARRLQQGAASADGAAARRHAGPGADGRVTVDIRATVTPALVTAITEGGGRVLNAVVEAGEVRADVPLDAVEALAARGDVHFIEPAADPVTRDATTAAAMPAGDIHVAKVNTSQGDVAHRADRARALYGVSGAGVGVGVLSDGVNTLAARQGSGDLPAVTVLGGQAGAGDRGTAMLEIVHDLAPGAALFFATASGGEAQFAANIAALCAAGARVIVDDVSYVTEAVFQDGVVAQAVNAATANGCVYVTAAGNAGNSTDGTSGVWEGDFLAAASTPPGAAGTAHDFGGASANQITQDTTRQFTLQWSDPYGASANDYDLFLFDASLTTVLDSSTDSQSGSQDPFESIDSSSFNDTNNRLVIVRFSGATRYLHLNTHGGRLAAGTSGQIAGHAGARTALTIAAVDVASAGGGAFTGGAANPVHASSSDGRRRIFYHPDGSAITPGVFTSSGGSTVQKPDLAAASCVATATPGMATFCGTSAAAAHAAGMAALMLEASPGLTRTTLGAAMAARALDIEAAGVDADAGAGLIDALGAVGRTHPPFTDSPIVAGATIVRALHVAQLRQRVNALRVRCGLPEYGFTDGLLAGGATRVRATHIAELRAALDAAYGACGTTPPGYSDPALVAGSTPVKAAHLNELRAAVTALE
jgi:hypothetical protein